MVTFSLCMIVRNEEAVLKKCLDSAKTIADEIIIVDTGSEDQTKKIALQYTDKVFDFEWCDNFSAARNFSFSHATKDYILWLDADDIILPQDIEKFKALKNDLSSDVSVVMLKYNTGFDNNGNVNFSCFRERIVKRASNFKWKEPVHEYIETYGTTIYGSACVTHTQKPKRDSSRNIKIYEKLLKNNETLSTRGTYYYARELKDLGRFADAADYFEKFLNSNKGWVEDNISACNSLAQCYINLEKPAEALTSLLRSFSFDVPRAQTCCMLGYFFKERNRINQAIYWFLQAIESGKSIKRELGFCQQDYKGYIPSLELAVCYSQQGDNKKAAEFNEKAATYKPDCPIVSDNRKYFEKIFNKK